MRRTVSTILVSALVTLGACGGETDEATAAKIPDDFFGVVSVDPPSGADFARMGRGNVGSYHLLLLWTRVESREGTYNWSAYDSIAGHLATEGIKPVPYLFGTPEHLTRTAQTPPTAVDGGLAGWKRFLKAAAERYGPGGDFWDDFAETHPNVEPQPFEVWEIWNEQNGPAFWPPKPDPDAYAKLLKVSSATLKKVDPNAEVIVAGMFATPSSNLAINAFDFLKQLYEVGGVREAIDIVGIHPYAANLSGVRRQIERTRKVMDDAGDTDADTWVTEIGWGSNPEVDSELAKTRTIQARRLTGAYQMMLRDRQRWNLRGALWYSFRDPDPSNDRLCGWCPSAGLLDRDLDAKPAWLAFTDLTGGLP